ncbi:ArnT family glycosyltransferase [Streptacidiphilus cavernicola]|uniref:ArnT family glycosyltransferase n=1 Tax=Streptacidiphilus cavernicola TaxID=3342716 RepID=A0ABV6W2X3_9ACTN
MATTATLAPALPRPRTLAEPRYARPALILVTAVAAVLYAWGIGRSQYHPFYADAVRSMTGSWKAFVYGSFDPGNTITLDKLPGFLWPQALSARVFGFHAWALTLPQVIEGVLSVLVLYRAVRRWAGVNAGLLAAGFLALTPVVAGLFRTAVEDPAFTLLLLLAADAAQRAAREARLRTLVLSGVWVGLAFQAKMLEAFAVLPALALVYAVSAPAPLRRRAGHLAVAGAVALGVSASWMLLVTLTPAGERPYVDGSTNNSAVSMVVGYNFLTRFSSLGVNAADTGSVPAMGAGRAEHGAAGGAAGAGAAGVTGAGRPGLHGTAGAAGSAGGAGAAGSAGTAGTAGSVGVTGAAGAAGTAGAADVAGSAGAAGAAVGSGGVGAHAGGGRHGGFGGGDSGWGKLLSGPMAAETGWFYPLALAGLGLGLVRRRRMPRTDPLRAGLLLWGCWLGVFFLVLSAGSVGGHTYYLGVIAAPLAALAGAGTVLLWRAYRAGGPAAWVLPGTVAATAAWGAVLADGYPSFLPPLVPAVLLLGLVAVLLLSVPLLRRSRPERLSPGRLSPGRAGLVVGLAAMLAAPAVWTASVLDPAYESAMGAVGPPAVRNLMGFQLPQHQGKPASALAMGSPEAGAGTGTAAARAAGGAAAGFAAAMRSSGTLTPSQTALYDYTRAHRGTARFLFATTSWTLASPYILATGAPVLPIGGFGGQAPSPSLAALQGDVGSGALRYVLLSDGTSALPWGGGAGGSATTAAAQASRWVSASCAAVPPGSYGGGVAGTRLYDCS